MAKIYYGIDLGKKGAVVVYSEGKILHKEIMPLVAGEGVDVRAIARIFKKFGTEDCHAIFEKFSGFFGYQKSAAVSLAHQGGMIESMIIMMGIPYTRIDPRVWQKVIWAGTKMITKSDGKKDTKGISLLTVKRLFPKENFIPTAKSKNPHDGMVDAVLLSVYAERKQL